MLLQRSACSGPFRPVVAGRKAYRSCQRPSVRSNSTSTDTLPLPQTVEQMASQAGEIVKKAQAAGSNRQLLELLNPVNEKAVNFLSTEAIDYPCSNFKEFETIVGVAKAVLQEVCGQDTPLKTQRIDEGGLDGDLCAIITAGNKEAVALVWPTAEKLKQLKELAADGSIKLLLVVNALWKTEGNLVSELGIGPWRKANEDFIATFEPSYLLYEQRIGAPSSINMASGTRYESGAVLRLLRSYPGQYVVHVMSADGTSQAIGGFSAKPRYKELEDLIAKARKAKLAIFDVAKAASSLDLEAGKAPAAADGNGADEVAPAAGGWYTAAQVAEMDPKKLRRVLMSLGLPSAGTPEKLKQRAAAVAAAVEEGMGMEAAVDAARRLR